MVIVNIKKEDSKKAFKKEAVFKVPKIKGYPTIRIEKGCDFQRNTNFSYSSQPLSDDSNKYRENACMFMALRSDALNKTIYQASSSFQLAKQGLQVRQNMPMYPQEYRLQRIFPHITKRMEAV